MTTEETWQAIQYERETLVEYLETLDEETWLLPSRRTGWTVKQLVAHIILESYYTVPVILRYIIQARFDTNKFMDICAREYAKLYEPAEMLYELELVANERCKPYGISPTEVLIDLWIHKQDIAQATGSTPKLQPKQIHVMLDYIVRNPRSHGLKVIGIAQKLRAQSYRVTDYDNLVIGQGKNVLDVTAAQLLSLLINFK